MSSPAYLQFKPNEVMKERVSVFIPVPVSESRISKRYDTILSGTLNPNADEIAYFQRLVKKSVRIGFLLSQGGEFAFVVFSLANRLRVLPLELNKLLIIVVVLSTALTPHCLTKLEDGPPILPMTSLM
ncbi:hypothetical protein LWI29_011560 [Acer saccharum]|uniref:Uncharacterized protein n=1 Tax=Acer saccharum TaxID=4024 RepID=A0AA39S2U5_ACESA|nr:hypothetical protein LWI29_011560 [Acer saccharum]